MSNQNPEKDEWPPSKEPSSLKGIGATKAPSSFDWYAFQRVQALVQGGQSIPARQELFDEWKDYIRTFK